MLRVLFFSVLLTISNSLLSQPVPAPSEHAPEGVDALEIQFFSVGCFKLKYGESAIFTDPFFTHIPLKKVLFGKVVPDPAQIDPYLPELGDIDGTLVCHAHYDHILDFPYLSPKLPAHSPVIGSQTLKHTLAPFKLPHPVMVVNETMAEPDKDGEWITLDDGNIRILPIKAGHPNHGWFVQLWNNKVTEDLTEIPTKGKEWQEGVTLGFLIDFMKNEGQEIAYRIFFQSSSTPFPSGFVPQHIIDQHPVNAALLGMDFINMELKGERNVMPYLAPEKVIFCHWEDFFKPKTVPPKKGLIKKLSKQIEEIKENDKKGTEYIVPEWGAKYYLTPGN